MLDKPIIRLLPLPVLIILMILSLNLTADEIRLKDSSIIKGTIITMDEETLTLKTSFAGEIKIKRTEIAGIQSESTQTVTMSDGDIYTARLNYAPEEGQKLMLKEGPQVVISRNEIAGINVPVKTESDFWSGRVFLGMTGQEGNTDELSLNTRAEVNRKTEVNRLFMYAEANFQRTNEETTTEEYLLGASLEQDITETWFGFVSQDFEKDRFEELNLRSVTNVGLGNFFIENDTTILKGLYGLGYEFESFTDDTSSSDMILTIGYDFRHDFSDWWRIGHKFNYFPKVTGSFTEEFRLVSNAFTEVPISRDEAWKVRFTLRHKFNNDPLPGVQSLDTAYFLNIVYDWNQ